MPLQLFVDPATINCRKVLAGLDLIGAEFDLKPMRFQDGEHKSEAFLKINPNGTVPAAVDGDLKLFESNAILMYAADKTNSAASNTAYPRDTKTRAAANNWLFWEQTSWNAPNYVYATEHVFKPMNDMTPDLDTVAAATPNWHTKAAILEACLAEQGTWILGGTEPSIVDIAVGVWISLGQRQKLPLEGYSHINQWFAKLSQQPCWVKTQKAVDDSLSS